MLPLFTVQAPFIGNMGNAGKTVLSSWVTVRSGVMYLALGAGWGAQGELAGVARPSLSLRSAMQASATQPCYCRSGLVCVQCMLLFLTCHHAALLGHKELVSMRSTNVM